MRAHRIRKSVGAERTFSADLRAEADLVAALTEIGGKVWDRLSAGEALGRTVTLKVKYDNFRQLTRAQSHPAPVGSRAALLASGTGLLRDLCPVERGVRLLGLTVSGFERGTGLTAAAVTQLGLEL